MNTERPEKDVIDSVDRALVKAAQGGLALVQSPYAALAAEIGISEQDVRARLTRMLEDGVVRRIGVVPNHYKLGYTLNGMSVWDVPDNMISELGRQVGALAFVSHCYHRPRQEDIWPYNLFAMVHGREQGDVDAHIAEIKELLGMHCRGNDVLYSSKILKKTGLRLRD